MAKQYTHGNINYGFSSVGRTWSFKAPTFELFQKNVGGNANAHKIARLVAGGLARTKGAGLDNLARHHIAAVVG